MSSTKAAAIAALTQSLVAGMDEVQRKAMPAASYASRFEDNLLPTLTPEQVDLARGQLEGGDGGELAAGKDGRPPGAHAAHSSAAAAVNLFGAWLDRGEPLSVAGVEGLSGLQLEAKAPFQRGGTPPNLDALASGPAEVVGIESKLTETLARHGPRAWQESISRPQNLALLDGGFAQTLKDAIAGSYSTNYLEPGQLLRHALGLAERAKRDGATGHLVYCYWEPADADQHQTVLEHRAEASEFEARVAGSSLRFHAITHRALIDSWDTPRAPAWLKAHCAAWRTRYSLALTPADEMPAS